MIEARVKAEVEAKVKAEVERVKAEVKTDQEAKAEREVREKAEQEARFEARVKAEVDARAKKDKAEQEARLEARVKAEVDARAEKDKAEQGTKNDKAEKEARVKTEKEARAKAEKDMERDLKAANPVIMTKSSQAAAKAKLQFMFPGMRTESDGVASFVFDALERGVNVKFLKAVYAHTEKLFRDGTFNVHCSFPDGTPLCPAEKFEDVTTTHVVYLWVKELSVTGDRRLVDCPELLSSLGVSQADVGIPTFFVSHAWKGSFKALMLQTLAALRDASETDTFVWMDMWAVK